MLLLPLSFSRHRWLVIAFIVIVAQVVLNLFATSLKFMSDVDWLDIIGEGGGALLILAWLLMLIRSRPGGRVTDLFALGLLTLFCATLQDALDEILLMDSSALPHGLIESITLPMGMLLLTYAMFLWQQEQRAINRQLRKREQLFREHECIDGVTQLHQLGYLKKHLNLLLRQNARLSILLLDLRELGEINTRFGAREGDRVLHAVSELLLLNLRGDDLLCRYAGNRFAILLPDTGYSQAEPLAKDLLAAIKSFGFRSRLGERHYLTARIGLASSQTSAAEFLLQHAREALLQAKQSQRELVSAGSEPAQVRLA